MDKQQALHELQAWLEQLDREFQTSGGPVDRTNLVAAREYALLTRAALDAGATEHDIDAIFDRLKAKNIAQTLTTS
ncbi:hypothetical protein [Rhodococcus qingshengii]|uniref:hypothetical protein n=1 Tax=Rhodococcus qingshengii TaxID=334542 RepID=UPI0021B14FDB|nr:hypothetical protein [Rhodococcus qingshengii]MCT6735271.1 hypothetical protein [Rhodococcus qingshengii]